MKIDNMKLVREMGHQKPDTPSNSTYIREFPKCNGGWRRVLSIWLNNNKV